VTVEVAIFLPQVLYDGVRGVAGKSTTIEQRSDPCTGSVVIPYVCQSGERVVVALGEDVDEVRPNVVDVLPGDLAFVHQVPVTALGVVELPHAVSADLNARMNVAAH